MKNRFTQLFLIALMTVSAAACQSEIGRAESVTVQNETEVSTEQVFSEEDITGGWTMIDTEDKAASEAAVAALKKAAGELDGASYEPVTALASQVVAGTNYMLLCKVTPVVPNAKGSYCLVTVYEDLEGKAEITSAKDVIDALDEKVENSTTGKVVEPLKGSVDVANLSDGIFDVGFAEGSDVSSGENGQTQIRMDVYEKVLFDAVDVSTLAVGDTLRIDGEEITVTAIKETNGGIQINEDGVYTLSPSDGGTYMLVGSSDYVSRVKVGEVKLPIGENFQMHDSSDPEKAEQTISREEFIKRTSGSDKVYTPGNTTVRVENGTVVELTHTYMP